MSDKLILAVCTAFLIVVALLVTAFAVWEQLARFSPHFEMVVEVDAPKKAGCFEAYFNGNFISPVRACLAEDGPSVLILGQAPSRVSIIRFDPGMGPDVEIVIRSVKFVTAKSYVPAPGVTLREYGPDELSRWTAHDMTVDAATGRARLSGVDPQLHARLDLDLTAALGATPQGVEMLAHLSPSVLILLALEIGLALFLAGILWRLYRRAVAGERHAAWIVAISLLGFAVTVLSAFPGHTNFDELATLSAYWNGTLTDIHPPLQTLVWSGLMDVGRALGLGPAGQAGMLLVVQAAFFWSAAGVMAAWLKSKWLARGFLLVLALSPISIVYLGHIGKDSEMAIALFVAIVWLGEAVRRRSLWLFAASLLPLFYGFAVRSNGPAAVLPLCFVWIIAAYGLWGFELRPIRRKAIAAVLSLVFFAGLIGLNRGVSELVVRDRCCYGATAFMTFIYDLMGVSVRVDQNLIPPDFYHDPNYDLTQIKKYFNPTTLDWTGLARIRPEQVGLVATSWIGTLKRYPQAMTRHRLTVLAYFFGFHSGPARVPYMSRFYAGSHKFRLPPRAATMVAAYESMSPQYVKVRNFFERYFGASRGWPVYKFWIYVLVFAALMAFPAPRPRHALDPVIWFAASAAFYVLPYLALANSAQFRYLWWSALALFAASVMRLDAILAYRRER